MIPEAVLAGTAAGTILSAQQKALSEAGCEVAFDNLTRQLYATDASIYQVEPAGGGFSPGRTKQAAARLSRRRTRRASPVIPRGAGTGLAGGAIGDGPGHRFFPLQQADLAISICTAARCGWGGESSWII